MVFLHPRWLSGTRWRPAHPSALTPNPTCSSSSMAAWFATTNELLHVSFGVGALGCAGRHIVSKSRDGLGQVIGFFYEATCNWLSSSRHERTRWAGDTSAAAPRLRGRRPGARERHVSCGTASLGLLLGHTCGNSGLAQATSIIPPSTTAGLSPQNPEPLSVRNDEEDDGCSHQSRENRTSLHHTLNLYRPTLLRCVPSLASQGLERRTDPRCSMDYTSTTTRVGPIGCLHPRLYDAASKAKC